MIEQNLRAIWDYLVVRQTPRKADIIFLFGTQDEQSPVKAAELYNAGYAPKVIVSGGYGPFTAGKNQQPEATIFGDMLISLGVTADDIILETVASNTGENIKLGMQAVGQRGLDVNSAILVSRPYMMKRILATFTKLFPEVVTISCPSDNTLEQYVAWMDEVTPGRAGNRLQAEIERLIKYPKEGYMAKVTIPNDILEITRQAGL